VVLPDSRRISRVPHYLGESRIPPLSFVYGAITLYGTPFQSVSTRQCAYPPPLWQRTALPATPHTQRPQASTRIRFRLIPVRSPLLGESLLLSFPRATEMFQFARLPPPALCVQAGGDVPLRTRGFPIRRSPGQRLLAPNRGSFVACHVLHRLSVPRHPSCALSSLTAQRESTCAYRHFPK
jgi:hypothetical protein